MYQTMDIPGPASVASIAAIVLGVVVSGLGVFGYSAARQRKILGKEFKGKIKLIVYATILGIVLAALLAVGITLFVWLGGTVPDSGHDQVNSAAETGVDYADKPVHNFVGCIYDVCCIDKVTNRSEFNAVSCKINSDDVPSISGEEMFNNATNGSTIDSADYPKVQKSCNKFSDIITTETCDKGAYALRQAVGQWLNDHLKPLAVTILALAGLILAAWVFAIMEIFWCCGLSDMEIDDEDFEDEDRTKVYPEEDDY